MLFSDFQRTDASAKRYRETEFEFLDRSASAEVAPVRALLEQEFKRYAEADKLAMGARLRARRAREHRSACFELLLYGLLQRQGHDVEIHPDPGTGTGNRPDFLVTSPAGERFFVEAVLASEAGVVPAAAEAIMDDVLDTLDNAPHPDFYLDISHRGAPRSQPAPARLAREIHRWLDTLDVDQVRAAMAVNDFAALPHHGWAHDGWELEFRALAKHENQGQLDRLLGILSGGAGWVDLKTPIREAIRFKGRRYGDLPHPFIIAVNVEAFYLRGLDELEALFGSEAVNFAGETPRLVRSNDGVWHDGNRPRSSRVSGAWLFNDLDFYSLPGRRHTLYLNPWALRPLEGAFDWLPTVRLGNGEFVQTGGPSPGEIYGLA